MRSLFLFKILVVSCTNNAFLSCLLFLVYNNESLNISDDSESLAVFYDSTLIGQGDEEIVCNYFENLPTTKMTLYFLL